MKTQWSATDELNKILANEYALFTKTLDYHWNVTGPRFSSLHKFLENHYKETLGIMDTLAERIRIMGKRPIGTISQVSKNISLEERNSDSIPSSQNMLEDLYSSHQEICNEIVKTIRSEEKVLAKDPGTEDCLVEILRKHEFMCWEYRSHLMEK